MEHSGLSLDRWANFYVVSGTVAATLIGLLFVVITLAAERRSTDEVPKIGLYLTPTVVQFGAVVLIACILVFPTHTRLTVALSSGAVGVVGWIYCGYVFVGRRASPVSFENPLDMIPYLVLPCVAFGALVGGATWLRTDPQAGLTVVAAGMLMLLVVAIRNSWAIAVTVVTSPRGRNG